MDMHSVLKKLRELESASPEMAAAIKSVEAFNTPLDEAKKNDKKDDKKAKKDEKKVDEGVSTKGMSSGSVKFTKDCKDCKPGSPCAAHKEEKADPEVAKKFAKEF